MTQRVPQVIVTLSPEGKLVLELPGVGTRRKVDLKEGHTEETLLRILRAQQENRTEIGTDGAPTEAQVRHWERHEIFPSEKCRFCISEGRISGAGRVKRTKVLYKTNGVEVRRIAPKTSGLKPKKVAETTLTTEELGL